MGETSRFCSICGKPDEAIYHLNDGWVCRQHAFDDIKSALYDRDKRIAELEAQLADAQASIARKQALLKRLEWSETGWEDPDYCEVCKADRPKGHMSHCALAAELKEKI